MENTPVVPVPALDLISDPIPEKYIPTQEDFFAFSLAMHMKAHNITLVKNKDYSPGGYPFSNFDRMNEPFGDDFGLKMLIARIQEKADRLISYAVNGHSDLNSEPIDNDFLDLCNYAILCLAYVRSKRGEDLRKFK